MGGLDVTENQPPRKQAFTAPAAYPGAGPEVEPIDVATRTVIGDDLDRLGFSVMDTSLHEDQANISAFDADRHEIDVLGFRINPLTGDEVVSAVADAVAARRRLVVANINTHAMAAMFGSEAMAGLLMQPDTLVMIDSMPVLFIANLLGHGLSRDKRTTSLDFYDDMFRLGVERDWRFAYVGAGPHTLRDGLAVLRQRYPGLDIEGRDGFFERLDMSSGSKHAAIVDWLREKSHDVVIAGMGMPRQEEWIAQVQTLVPTRVFLPAGAYLDYQIGVQKMPPRWLGRIGLEWAFRLVHAPRRLGYRYLVEPLLLLFWLLTRRHPQAGFRHS